MFTIKNRIKMSKLYQCPYEKATKCDLRDCCLECEIFGEYLNGNTTPVLNVDKFIDDKIHDYTKHKK